MNASTGNLSAYSLIVAPTDSSPTASGLDNSQCAARLASNSTGGLGGAGNMVMNRTEPAWMRIGPDGPGYRVAWAVGGLQSGTNYTVWLEEGGTLSAPAWFSTKSRTSLRTPLSQSRNARNQAHHHQPRSPVRSYCPRQNAPASPTPPPCPSPHLHLAMAQSSPRSPTPPSRYSKTTSPPSVHPSCRRHVGGTSTRTSPLA